jgi:hypothetical protein
VVKLTIQVGAGFNVYEILRLAGLLFRFELKNWQI